LVRTVLQGDSKTENVRGISKSDTFVDIAVNVAQVELIS
jgi:hypothetical protein